MSWCVLMPPRRSGKSFNLSVRRLIVLVNPSVNDSMPLLSPCYKALVSLLVTPLDAGGSSGSPGGWPAACRWLRMPGVLPFLTLNPYSYPCGVAAWAKRSQSWFAEQPCITNWHGGMVQALDRRDTWSLALQSPNHGVLVPQTCSACNGGQISQPFLLSCWSEGSRCSFFKKDALLQSTSDTCIAPRKTNVQLMNRICQIIWYLWDKVHGWFFNIYLCNNAISWRKKSSCHLH